MKQYFKPLAAALALAVLGGFMPALGTVPLRWNVETSRAQPASFDVYRGETLELHADLLSYGRPIETAGAVALYVQTNGMDDAWWIIPATAASNRIEAVLSPTDYPGDAQYLNCFLGGPATSYRAAFRLRVLGSPGSAPSSVQLPARVLDFSTVTVQNAPWTSAAEATNAAEAVVARAAFRRDGSDTLGGSLKLPIDGGIEWDGAYTLTVETGSLVVNGTDRVAFEREIPTEDTVAGWGFTKAQPVPLDWSAVTNAAEAVVARDALPRMYGEAECLTLRRPTVLYGTASATNAVTVTADGLRFGRAGYAPALEIGLSAALAPVLKASGHTGFDWIRDGDGNGLSHYYAARTDIPDLEQYVTWSDANLQFVRPSDLPYSFAATSSSSVTVTNGTTTTVTTSAGAVTVNLAQMPGSPPASRDAVIYLVNSAECSVTVGSAIRVADGSTWPTLAAGEWLVSITEIAPGTNFVASIRLADPTAQ